MAHYSPEMLAALRHDYEKTDRPMRLLAADYKIGVTTLQTLAEKHGWLKRSQRPRGCPPNARLIDEVQTLQAAMAAGPPAAPAPAVAMPAGAAPPAGETPPPVSAIDRIEAMLMQEIEAAEAAQARLRAQPRSRAEADHCARTLSGFAQILHALHRLRAGLPEIEPSHADDDMPADIDEFRRDLARRIDAFVASRTDAGDADGYPPPGPLAKV